MENLGQRDTVVEEPHGWFLLPSHVVPQRWRHRAVDLSLIALLPEEAASVLAGEPAHPVLDERDAALARLLVRGLTISDIATEIDMSVRGVQRRLAGLRERFDVETTAGLRALFAGRGLGAD